MNAFTCKNRRGLLPVTIGLLLIMSAFLLVLYNIWDAGRAKEASDEIVSKLREIIPDEAPELPEYEASKEEMPVEEIDGYFYIGMLDIPELDLVLPVMAEWDYERLKISPCRYAGSYYSENMVICAHNYSKHFSPIKWIDIGADIYFTNVEGQTYHYQVSSRETVQPADVEYMIENTEKDWDMTLFTCSTGGQTRCAVRCVHVP